MKIGIDISQIIYKGTGVSRFTQGLVDAILMYDRNNEWVFFFSSLRQNLPSGLENRIKSRGHKLVSHKLPPIILSYIWNTLHILPIEKLVGHLDWFITSDWTEPPSSIRKATIVHDLVYLRYPDTLHKTIVKTQKKKLQWIKKESDIVFSDSEATKKDLIKFLDLNEQSIKTIYPGIIQPVQRQQAIRKPFILAVGKIEPRKNLKRLIEAFAQRQNKNIELLIAGVPGWGKIKSHEKNVKFLGYVSDEELSNLYSTCLFFIYPSLWEGFGYPVVEAMSYGAPVATSATSSLGEIGRKAAYLFDPTSTAEIRMAIDKLTTDVKLRDALSVKGLKKSREFTWMTYYNELISSLQSF